MKKLITTFFTGVMMLGMVFIGDAVSSNAGFSAEAQTVTVRRKKRPGAIRSAYRGGRWVTVRVYRGGKWVTRRVWRSTKYAGRQTVRGAKWTGRKAVRGTKKAARVTKRVVY